MSDLRSWLALLAIPVDRFPRRALLAELIAGASPEAILARPLVGGGAAGCVASLADHGLIEAWLRRMERAGLDFLPVTAPAYPQGIRALTRPPLGLFVKGRVELTSAPAIAVVGRRRAGVDGCRLAHTLAGGLAGRGFAVVSGLAEGIDAAAHKGALDASGDTLAVLGAGPDVVYPPGNEELHDAIGARGLLLSEYPPGTEPLAGQFPARNRLVVALSGAVVVVEAGRRSGALITAGIALRRGVPVFAIPGAPGDGGSAGTNALLKSGRAALVESAGDVIGALEAREPANPTAPAAPAPPLRAAHMDNRPVPSAARTQSSPRALTPLAARLGRRAVGVDLLAAELGRPVPELLVELLELELAGYAEATDGGLAWRRVA